MYIELLFFNLTEFEKTKEARPLKKNTIIKGMAFSQTEIQSFLTEMQFLL